jgi:hypothetical protein
MTTFTTEDRLNSAEQSPSPPEKTWEERWGKTWVDAVRKDWNIQRDIVWFWPLTEQLGLDLDYGPTHLHYRAQGIAGVHSMPIQGTIYEFSNVATTWGAVTNIAPQLTVHPTNSVGQLNIGGISVGLENEPKWYSKILYKLLGFNWKK